MSGRRNFLQRALGGLAGLLALPFVGPAAAAGNIKIGGSVVGTLTGFSWLGEQGTEAILPLRHVTLGGLPLRAFKGGEAWIESPWPGQETGQRWLDTDAGVIKRWDGEGWVVDEQADLSGLDGEGI